MTSYYPVLLAFVVAGTLTVLLTAAGIAWIGRHHDRRDGITAPRKPRRFPSRKSSNARANTVSNTQSNTSPEEITKEPS